MKRFGFTVKPGLIVTLAIGLGMIIFRLQFLGTTGLVLSLATGKPVYCSLPSAINSLADADKMTKLLENMSRNSRLIFSDPIGIDLVEVNSKKVWVPHGAMESAGVDAAEQKYGIYHSRRVHVQPGDLVLDAGAFIGYFTRKALEEGASKVIAIEPVPINLLCLRRNLSKEIEEGKVVVYAKGVWDKDDSLEMNVSQSNPDGSTFVGKRPDGHSVVLPLTTIDRIVREIHLSRVDFIKMDIEGAERRALSGAMETIKRFHPRMVICTYHLADDPIVIPAKLRGLNYHQSCGLCATMGPALVPQEYFFY